MERFNSVLADHHALNIKEIADIKLRNDIVHSLLVHVIKLNGDELKL